MTSRWNQRSDVPRGDDYDAKWRALAASGQSVHGEADLVSSFAPSTVLDAGCGTGRVAIELARRGLDVVGVDLDPGMLDTARIKAPEVEWILGDLSTVAIGRTFDLIALPGNVMIFVHPGTEAAVVANLARHLNRASRLVAGFQLGPDRLTTARYDEACLTAGLQLEDRWSTWDREPFDHGDYQVSVHRLV
ncbi:MAG: SAM-dependent methyltransferase [Candidatus Poriferisodalaceae bacterium]